VKLIPAQGQVVIAAAFGLGIAFATYSAGDFIDWKRTEDGGFFDFVRGVRRTVEDALPAPPPAPAA
jgi:hypothetical protein